MAMTPKEVILKAFALEKPDRIPVTLFGAGMWSIKDFGTSFEALAGDPKKMAEMCVAEAARIRSDVQADEGSWENLCSLATPDGTLLLGLSRPEHRAFVGRDLAGIAEASGKDWIDTAMDLVLAEGRDIDAIFFMMSEENVQMQMRPTWMKFGTDAGGVDPERPDGPVHPRAYGSYPRILGRYVREERVLTLEDAVRKMSSAVAVRLGIRDRGILAPGYFADLVVFDPDRVLDLATYDDPHRTSVGVEYVLVNGVPVVRDGRHTGAMPGRAVRGPGWIGHQP